MLSSNYLVALFVSAGCSLLIGATSLAQTNISQNIRLNQIGFYPLAPKIAIISSAKSGSFNLQNRKNETVFSGSLKKSVKTGLNQKTTYFADFSALQDTGEYHLLIPGIGRSYSFKISENVHREVSKAAIKAFYFQRASIGLPFEYAAKWHRAAGHPDTAVKIHPSAATSLAPSNTHISSPKGWYDAGDYNKYIVNSGITTGTLLSLYEDFPDYIKNVNLNIPESNNQIPDLLDEILWNLRWMLTMQDSNDGGVYTKLTNADFDAMIMPGDAKEPRYVVQKSTGASLNFAAVMAQASRVFKAYSNDLPGLSDSCLTAAKKAWAWAKTNPEVFYKQKVLNAKYKPAITTGEYGDTNFEDEFIWAASELYIATKDVSFYKAVNIFPDSGMPIPNWKNVRLLGYYTLARNQSQFEKSHQKDFNELKRRMLAMADQLVRDVPNRAYQTVMGKNSADFRWGSNSLAANQGIALIQAYQLSGNKKYLDYALTNLDYLLGRNATGYSYVTGFGAKTPMFPHHRPSAADSIHDPIPGFLVGGPNPGKQDALALASYIPDEAYIDKEESYATNEIAINWNASFVYLSNAIEALQFKIGN